MCRSPNNPAYRRCRKSHSPEQRLRDSARQRLSRHARACDAAIDRGDLQEADHSERLMNKALEDLGQRTATPQMRAETTAHRYTAETTADWTDEDFDNAVIRSFDDPAALAQLQYLMDERDGARTPSPEELAAHDQAMSQFEAVSWAQPSPLTSTANRPSRKLTTNEICRAEYDTYVDVRYLQAEEDCKGVLLTAEARAKGISPRELFSGNTQRALKYASPELQSWWGRHGRVTFTAFRYQMLGRDSDKDANDRVRLARFENAPAW